MACSCSGPQACERTASTGGVGVMTALIAGLASGSIYALVALTLNVLYRPTNTFNFAQGDLVMIGGLVAASVITVSGCPGYWVR